LFGEFQVFEVTWMEGRINVQQGGSTPCEGAWHHT
jgi:hypothetical protein